MTPVKSVRHATPLGPAAGAACGLAAAVGYAAANVALKASTPTDAILVAAFKSVPTILACAPLLVWMRYKGQPLATSWRPFPFLVIAVSLGQLLGNLMFQVSLGIIGLALAVPLNLGAMIIGGALCGKWILGEPVGRRTIVAIIVLIAAATILSLGSNDVSLATGTSPQMVALGIAATLLSGAVYSLFGTAMRKSLREGLTVPLAMMISGIAGVFWLTPIAVARLGTAEILATPLDQWLIMSLAGTFNMAAFFLLAFSLRSIPVVAVNLLNAAQAALAAIAGVWWFEEPLTKTLVAGSLLTIFGLGIMGLPARKIKQRSNSQPAEKKPTTLESRDIPSSTGDLKQVE